MKPQEIKTWGFYYLPPGEIVVACSRFTEG